MDEKTCTECATTKPFADFYRNNACRDGRHTKCKPCIKAAQAQYRAGSAERIRARRHANRDTELAATRRWYERNPGRDARYYQEHREQRAANGRAWLDRNPGYARERKLRRRARMNQPFDKDLAREYVAIISSDPCIYCGADSIEIDHIVPVARGGSGAWDNLAPACTPCNRSKHTRSVLEMMLRRLAA